jgi:hypothetical protein
MKKRYILGEGHLYFLQPHEKGYQGIALLNSQYGCMKKLRHVGKIGTWLKGKLIFEVEKR